MENVTETYAGFSETSTAKDPPSTDWLPINTTSAEQSTAEFVNQTHYDWVLVNTTSAEQSTAEFVNQTHYTLQPTSGGSSYSYEDYYADYYAGYGDVYMYPGYGFERPVYLYIWEILVIVTSLVNAIVISVLLRRKMRNPTNIVLATIAISDSLTGLVTLPTYIMVFLRYDPIPDSYDYAHNNTYDNQYDYPATTTAYEAQEAVDGYILSGDLCRGFMISKYFLSKSFHTMSIFLTLFLGIQRYISIAFPYKSQLLLNMNKTIICCVVILVASPILHVYHLVTEKAVEGLCQWELKEKGCGGGCIYLWIAFIIRHLIPCLALVIFTGLFIRQLRVGEKNLRRMDSNKSQLSRRSDENRRISFIVTAVVIVFLIPEVPYGIFLLYNAIDKTANQGKGIRLEANRAIHMVYELFLVLSFHANFYIYTLFNRRFRKTLYRTFFKPIRRLIGDPSRLSLSSLSSRRPSNRKTETGSTRNKFEMETMITNGPDQSKIMETKSVGSSLIGKDMVTFQGETNTDL